MLARLECIMSANKPKQNTFLVINLFVLSCSIVGWSGASKGENVIVNLHFYLPLKLAMADFSVRDYQFSQ